MATLCKELTTAKGLKEQAESAAAILTLEVSSRREAITNLNATVRTLQDGVKGKYPSCPDPLSSFINRSF